MGYKDIKTRNEYRKKWRAKNKDKVLAQRKRYAAKKIKSKIEKPKLTAEQIKERKQLYYTANRDKLLNSQKEWRNKNKEKIREKQKIKYKNNKLYKLKTNIKNLIGNAIRNAGFKKLSKTEQILGCTYNEFKQYLEAKFDTWMNWDNHGQYNGLTQFGWDIDHIIPLDTATCEADIIRLCHYTNLQPLCSYINRDIKKNKVIHFCVHK